MITYKTLTIEDLKRDYLNRHGFFFKGPQKSSDKAIENLCNTLIQHNITKEFPEFVVRLDDLTTVFVYKDDFDAPPFFHKATIATQMGICQVESIYNVLK